MQEKWRVKVWIRGAVQIRSICSGYVVLFDKHMNMVLRDVDEVYRNPLLLVRHTPGFSAQKKKKRNKKKQKKSSATLSSHHGHNTIETGSNCDDPSNFIPHLDKEVATDDKRLSRTQLLDSRCSVAMNVDGRFDVDGSDSSEEQTANASNIMDIEDEDLDYWEESVHESDESYIVADRLSDDEARQGNNQTVKSKESPRQDSTNSVGSAKHSSRSRERPGRDLSTSSEDKQKNRESLAQKVECSGLSTRTKPPRDRRRHDHSQPSERSRKHSSDDPHEQKKTTNIERLKSERGSTVYHRSRTSSTSEHSAYRDHRDPPDKHQPSRHSTSHKHADRYVASSSSRRQEDDSYARSHHKGSCSSSKPSSSHRGAADYSRHSHDSSSRPMENVRSSDHHSKYRDRRDRRDDSPRHDQFARESGSRYSSEHHRHHSRSVPDLRDRLRGRHAHRDDRHNVGKRDSSYESENRTSRPHATSPDEEYLHDHGRRHQRAISVGHSKGSHDRKHRKSKPSSADESVDSCPKEAENARGRSRPLAESSWLSRSDEELPHTDISREIEGSQSDIFASNNSNQTSHDDYTSECSVNVDMSGCPPDSLPTGRLKPDRDNDPRSQQHKTSSEDDPSPPKQYQRQSCVSAGTSKGRSQAMDHNPCDTDKLRDGRSKPQGDGSSSRSQDLRNKLLKRSLWYSRQVHVEPCLESHIERLREGASLQSCVEGKGDPRQDHARSSTPASGEDTTLADPHPQCLSLNVSVRAPNKHPKLGDMVVHENIAGEKTSMKTFQDVLRRHVNQLLIRGDNVVLVALADR